MAEEEKQQEKGKDLIPRFSRSTMILRRNLIAVSTLALMALGFDLEITASNFLGIGIVGLTEYKIYWAAFFLILYFTLHFIWNAKIEYNELCIESVILHPEFPEYTEVKLTPFKNIRRAINNLLDEANYPPPQDQPPDYEEISASINEEELNNLRWMEIYAAIRFYGFDIGLPIVMATCAMFGLVLSMIVAAFFPH